MLSSLHTYRIADGDAVFAPFSQPKDPALAAVTEQLPTSPDGFYESVEFIRPIPEEVLSEARALFHTDRDRAGDSYLVDTRGRAVRVYSDGLRGLSYGAYALLQSARESADGKSVPRGLLWDLPRCPFRGLKVYMPAPDDLGSFYRTVDLLLSLRYNTVIIEVGGAMEYKKHPEINAAWIEYCREMGRYPDRANEIQNKTYPWGKNSIHFENGGGRWLTQDTVRALVKYCKDRGMEVIPECPTLSHSDYLLMPHPELAERSDDAWPDAYCPSNPDTYKLVFDVLEEVLGVFEPRIVHIGHDEYYSIGVCPRCRGKAAERIYADDVTMIHDWLAERGVRTMLWAEKLLDAIGLNGEHFGGSEARERRPDGTVEIVRPATWRAVDLIPRDVIAHHWYWSIAEYFDDEFTKRGIPLWYGNFCPVNFLDWNRRLAQGAEGGSPSHWSSLEDATMQRNGVFLSLFFGTRMFWDETWDDARFPEYLDEVLLEMYLTANRQTLAGPHFLIEHTATIERRYQYLSSVPMQTERDTVGRYEIEYEDGETVEIPLVYGLNITGKNRVWERHYQGGLYENPGLAERDTWSFDSKLAEVTYTTLPLRRGSETWYRIAVPDPHPEKGIAAVRTVKTCADEGDILLGSLARRA